MDRILGTQGGRDRRSGVQIQFLRERGIEKLNQPIPAQTFRIYPFPAGKYPYQ
jgi:hypothetical protein